MAAFIGSWKQESVDGLDAVLKSLGVNFLKRKAAAALPLTLHFSRTDDQYGLTISTSAQSFETSFQPDVPYADKNPDGEPVETTVTIVGDDLMKCQHVGGKTIAYTTRKVQGNVMYAEFVVNGLSCRRVYRRTESKPKS
ncbi:regulation of retrograde trans-synaptic signaling by endocanabinoid [Sparganum proliferum]